jgi:hypothetical protein
MAKKPSEPRPTPLPLWSIHRGRRDPHDDPAPVRPRPPAPQVPTLGQLLHQPYWLWLRCDACGHRVAVALVPFVIRWGADASSDVLRTQARCTSADDMGRACSIQAGPTWLWGGRCFLWRSVRNGGRWGDRGMKATRRMNATQPFRELTYTMRPQDSYGDGIGLRFETGERGGCDLPRIGERVREGDARRGLRVGHCSRVAWRFRLPGCPRGRVVPAACVGLDVLKASGSSAELGPPGRRITK